MFQSGVGLGEIISMLGLQDRSGRVDEWNGKDVSGGSKEPDGGR